MNNIADMDNEVFDSYQGSSLTNSKSMYIKEIANYPLLSEEEEKYYGRILQNKDNVKLLIFKEADGYSIPSLNIDLFFCSLCNNLSYQSIINDLMLFYERSNNNDKTIMLLKKYQCESNKVNRALNLSELQNIFNVTNNEQLSEKDLLIEIKEFIDYKLAFNKMVESNLRLVVSIATKYPCNIDTMDLIAEGNIGLIKAVIGFDISLGYRFSTYATACIKQTIKRYLSNYSSAVRIPEYLGKEVYYFKRKLDNLEQQEKRELSPNEISEKLELPLEQVEDYLMFMRSDMSLDEPISDTEDLTMQETIPSDINVENEVMQKFLKKDILELIGVLNERYQDIIKMKFSLGEYEGIKYTSRDIAQKYAISQQRITEIFHKSLYLMRRATKQKSKQKAISDYYYD